MPCRCSLAPRALHAVRQCRRRRRHSRNPAPAPLLSGTCPLQLAFCVQPRRPAWRFFPCAARPQRRRRRLSRNPAPTAIRDVPLTACFLRAACTGARGRRGRVRLDALGSRWGPDHSRSDRQSKRAPPRRLDARRAHRHAGAWGGRRARCKGSQTELRIDETQQRVYCDRAQPWVKTKWQRWQSGGRLSRLLLPPAGRPPTNQIQATLLPPLPLCRRAGARGRLPLQLQLQPGGLVGERGFVKQRVKKRRGKGVGKGDNCLRLRGLVKPGGTE